MSRRNLIEMRTRTKMCTHFCKRPKKKKHVWLAFIIFLFSCHVFLPMFTHKGLLAFKQQRVPTQVSISSGIWVFSIIHMVPGYRSPFFVFQTPRLCAMSVKYQRNDYELHKFDQFVLDDLHPCSGLIFFGQDFMQRR